MNPAEYLSPLELALIAELNEARADPRGYLPRLRDYRARFEGLYWRVANDIVMVTQEGAAPVDEAIAFMERQPPLPPLFPVPGLSRAAADHVRDIGPKGVLGHGGSDGSGVAERVARYGRWLEVVGENIGYGPGDARLLVIRQIVDDGVPDRGHRSGIFEPRYRVVGQACGVHRGAFEQVCVTVLAAGFVPFPAATR